MPTVCQSLNQISDYYQYVQEVKKMEFVSVRKFNSTPKNVQDTLKRDGKLVLTNHGQPIALVLHLDSGSLEETLALVQQAEERKFFRGLRAKAAQAGFMTADEIDAEIQAARSEIKADLSKPSLWMKKSS